MPLTDYYLDELANTGFTNSSTIRNFGYLMFAFCRIGTGSGAPSTSDLTLTAEIAGSSFNTSLGNFVDDSVIDTVGNEIIYDTTEGYVWTNSTGSGKAITEIGFSKTISGSLSYRDLLRSDPTNPASSAITLNVDNGEQLQVFNNRVYTLSFPALATDEIFIDDGSGNPAVAGKASDGLHDVSMGVYCAASAASVSSLFFYMLDWTNNSAHTKGTTYFSWDESGDTPTRNSGYSSDTPATHITATNNWDAYVSSSHQRTRRIALGTTQGNADWQAILFGVDSTSIGFLINFTNPTTLTKTSLIEAEVATTVSWARA